MYILILLLLAFASSPCSGATTRVQALNNSTKVVVLMLENRSLSHLFGYLLKELTGKEYNLVNSSDPSSQKIYLATNPSYVLDCDPDHGTPATTAKIFGLDFEERFGPGYDGQAKMDGFVEWERVKRDNGEKVDYCNVMSAYKPEAVPVATFLAQEFALFDRYYCSVAGPTWPNRAFALSGTSAGLTETGPYYRNQRGRLFPQTTFGQQLQSFGRSVGYYYDDTPWDIWMGGLMNSLPLFRDMEQFYADARDGSLPDYSWLWPRAAYDPIKDVGSNDQHPDHDVALGEALLKDVYDALRAGKDWNNTLLLITWDEHGGIWDPVPPPSAPPPDDDASFPDKNVPFNRLGIRVPLLAISPRIPAGTRVSEPPAAQKPFPDSQYDHTSMMATVRKLFGIDNAPLTRRDAWAGTFEHILSLEEPRSTPMTAPDPPPATKNEEHARPINDLQLMMLETLRTFGKHPATDAQTQGEVDLPGAFKRVRAHFASLNYSVFFAPHVKTQPDARVVTLAWTVEAEAIRTRELSVDHGMHLCLTAATHSNAVSIEPCFKGHPAQAMAFKSDYTVRNPSNDCLTAQRPPAGNLTDFGLWALAFEPCRDGDVTQHFAREVKTPGNSDEGYIFFGTGYLSVMKL